MFSIKTKIVSSWRKVKRAWPVFVLFKNKISDTISVDQKLVYSLSSRKIPSNRQIKHLFRFLNSKEILIIKICLLVLVVNLVYLGTVFVQKHLQYLPIAGGEYIEGVLSYPQTINPLYAVSRDIDADLSRLIYSSLLKYGPDGQLNNDLAESVIISDNGKDYVIRIKTDVFFHDGSRLSIDDVLFTYNLLKNSDYRSPLRSAFNGITIEKVDDNTIKFSLTEAHAPFIELLTVGILPKNIWENIGPSAATLSEYNLKPIGSGPFKFNSLTKNKNGELKDYVLVVNDRYYGQKPYLKNIKFKFFVDYSEAVKALNDNQITGISYLPSNLRGDLLAKNSLQINELPQAKIVVLFFNQEKNKALADKTTRLALTLALDKDKLINEVFSTDARRVDGPILAENFAYNNLPKYEYNLEKAKQDLANKNLSLTITVIDSGSNLLVAEQIKKYWEEAGVKIELKSISGEQAAELVRTRNFEALLYGEFIGSDPDVYAFWHSSQIGASGLNLANYNNKEVDTLLVEARASTKQEERINKYNKFQEIINNEVPVIFLYSPNYLYIQSRTLKGFSPSLIVSPADRFNSINNWYLKTNKKITW